MAHKFKYGLLFLLTLLLLAAAPMIQAAPTNEIEVVMFTGEGCPHCAKMKEAFSSWQKSDFPQAKLVEYEVYRDYDNQKLFAQYGIAFGLETDGVPVTLVGKEVIYGENLGRFRTEIEKCTQMSCPAPTQLFEQKKLTMGLDTDDSAQTDQTNYTVVGWVIIIMIILVVGVIIFTQRPQKKNQ
ncbi:TPA: hypothetical protein DF272_00135 [Candidatus Falkowbacteria bacterium]|nr:hypothetical protein [Candidatus Falkowbacteria bacterium]